MKSPSATPRRVIPLTYRDIAWWAEAADGLRDEALVIAEVEENGTATLRVQKRSEVSEEQIIIDGIRTESKFKGKPPVTRVLVEVNGKMVECKSKKGKDGKEVVCDSIFRTESAIEKFLFLYYHAQRLLTPEEWHKLYAAVEDPNVVVIGHVWPSTYVAVPKPDDTYYILKAKPDVRGGDTWVGLSEYQPPISRAGTP
jgi:hypothetical protein